MVKQVKEVLGRASEPLLEGSGAVLWARIFACFGAPAIFCVILFWWVMQKDNLFEAHRIEVIKLVERNISYIEKNTAAIQQLVDEMKEQRRSK